MKKIIVTAIAVLAVLAFTACDDGNGGGNTHTHSYSTTWSYNATQHWHECTANDGAKTDVANHDGDPCNDCGGSGQIRGWPPRPMRNRYGISDLDQPPGSDFWYVTVNDEDGVGIGIVFIPTNQTPTYLNNWFTSNGYTVESGLGNNYIWLKEGSTNYAGVYNHEWVANNDWAYLFVGRLNGTDGGTYTHTYSSAWSSNAIQHWHECIAGDGAKTAVANHTGSPCSVCGYSSSGGGGGSGTEANPIALTEGIWKDGSITSSSGAVWYSFNVTSGDRYYIWWNDDYEGNRTKTADVKVSAYYSSGTNIFTGKDNGWYTAQIVTASTSGTVKIKVELYHSIKTGTFAVAYNTSSTRP